MGSLKLDGVQYLRAIAAIAVVACHASAMAALPKYFGVNVLGGFLEYGAIGVDLFFVISGFIIVYTSLDGDLMPKIDYVGFLKKRFFRIVPLMWVAILAYALLRYAATGYLPVAEYLRAFFLFPFGEVDPNHIWTLRHEFIFYGMFCVSLLMGRRMVFLLVFWFFGFLVFWWFASTLVAKRA